MSSGEVHRIKFPVPLLTGLLAESPARAVNLRKFTAHHFSEGVEAHTGQSQNRTTAERRKEVNTMGFSKKSKTMQRNEISGVFDHIDVPDGTHSVNELRARNDARQQQVNDAHKKDWSNPNGMDSPAYGNAMDRQPKPSDSVAGSGDRYGKADEQPPKKGGALQKGGHPTVSGVMPASTSRG